MTSCDFLWFPRISCDFLWFLMFFVDFLWFPSISYAFASFWFPMISVDFLRFPSTFVDFLAFWPHRPGAGGDYLLPPAGVREPAPIFEKRLLGVESQHLFRDLASEAPPKSIKNQKMHARMVPKVFQNQAWRRFGAEFFMPFKYISNNYVQKGPAASKTAPKTDKNSNGFFGTHAKKCPGEG